MLTACASQRSAVPAPTKTPSVSAPRVAAALPRSYAALGASETYGVGATTPSKGYAHLVARALGARRFRDTGIPGATLNQAYDPELTSALVIRPSLCTVFFGFNDLRSGVTLKAFVRDLYDLAVTLHRAGAQVLIIGLPDLSLLPAVHRVFPDLHSVIAEWNAGMARVARQTGAHFLDLTRYSAELAGHPQYVSADGLHPSDAGHARLAQVVTAAIRQDRLWK